MNIEIGHRSCRQIQLQSLPVIAVVQGKINAVPCASIEQSLARWIFANHSRISGLGQAGVDQLPALSVITRAIDQRTQVAESVDHGVRGGRIVAGCFHQGHAAALMQSWNGHVLPGLAILRDLNQAIASACPDHASLHRRKRDGSNYGSPRIGFLLLFFCFRLLRKVGADFLPTESAVIALQNVLSCGIERVRILRRKRKRRHLSGAVLRTARQKMHDLPSRLVVAEHGAVPASGVNVVRIQRIGRDVTELESSGRRPITISDLAVIAAAGDCGGSAILLRRVHVIGKMLVGADVIELPGRLVVPRAPAIAAVHADDRTLVDSEDHVLRVRGVDPEDVEIVAAGRARPGCKGAASVGRAIHGSLRDVNEVSIPGINKDSAEVSVPQNARVGRAALPTLAAIF